jgi:YHS domain-containing protein
VADPGHTGRGASLLDAKTDKEQLARWHDEIAQLEAKIRAAKITVDTGAVITIIATATTNKTPVNTKCPVSDKDVDPTKTVVYEGATIAFCCDDCKAKFEKDPKEFAAKLNLPAKSSEAASKPINTKCPVSGEDVDPAKTLAYEGATVAFCCDDCKAKFEKDPKEFGTKLNLPAKSSEAASKPINTKCPVSGEDVDPPRPSSTKEPQLLSVAMTAKPSSKKIPKNSLPS